MSYILRLLTVPALLLFLSPTAHAAGPDLAWLAPGQIDSIERMALSPGGDALAVHDGTGIKLWSMATGNLIWENFAEARAIAYSPSNQLIATAMMNEIRFWNAADGTPAAVPTITDTGFDGSYRALTFSPDPGGMYIIAGGGTGQYPFAGSSGRIKVWRVTDGVEIATLSGHNYMVESLCVTHHLDYPVLASLGQSGHLIVYNISGWSFADDHAWGDMTYPTSVACSSDGQYIAAAGEDGALKLLERGAGSTYTDKAALSGHTGDITALVFQMHALVSAGRDRTIRWWSAEAGTLTTTVTVDHRFNPERGGIASMAGNSSVLAAGGDVGDGALTLRYYADRTLDRVLNYHRSTLDSILFRPYAGRFALHSLSQDCTAVRWQMDTGPTVVDSYTKAFDEAWGDLSPNGDYLLLVRYRTAPGVTMVPANGVYGPMTFQGIDQGASLAAFSPDGATVAAAGSDGTLALYQPLKDPSHIVPRRSTKAHDGWIERLQFAPDGLTLFTIGRDDHVIKVWRTEDLRQLHTFSEYTGEYGQVYGAVYSPDGSMIAAGGYVPGQFDWQFALRVSDGAQLRGYRGASLGTPVFSPDSQYLVRPVGSGGFEINRLADDVRVNYFSGTGSSLNAAAVSPDGNAIALVYENNTMTIRGLLGDSFLPVQYDQHLGWVRQMTYSPDSAHIGIGRADGTVMLARNPVPAQRVYLAVNSFGAEDVAIEAGTDSEGRDGGDTPFTLAYDTYQPGPFRAPDKVGKKSFRYWLLDGVQVTPSTGLGSVTLGRNRLLTAVYSEKGSDIPPVETPTPVPGGPTITRVKAGTYPSYELLITGTGFIKGAKLKINDRPWKQVTRLGSKKLRALGGAKLQALVKRRRPALITVTTSGGAAHYLLGR